MSFNFQSQEFIFPLVCMGIMEDYWVKMMRDTKLKVCYSSLPSPKQMADEVLVVYLEEI